MRHIGPVVAAAVLIGAGVGASSGLQIGDTIPAAELKMKNVDGRDLAVKDVAGPKGTLVIFSCNHCPYVKAWETRLVALGNDAGKLGVGVIAINPNDPSAIPEDGFDQMKERAKARGYAFPYVVDAGASQMARAFGATHTPEAFLFDPRGVLVYHGAIDDNVEDPSKVTRSYLRDAVDAVVSRSRPAVAQSKAIGCSLKLKS
ncbi:MAG: thioredoxin family protein [Acidobacteriia bacterium]|nr:thioredoxin family protein [Terriglobia bacterium]